MHVLLYLLPDFLRISSSDSNSGSESELSDESSPDNISTSPHPVPSTSPPSASLVSAPSSRNRAGVGPRLGSLFVRASTSVDAQLSRRNSARPEQLLGSTFLYYFPTMLNPIPVNFPGQNASNPRGPVVGNAVPTIAPHNSRFRSNLKCRKKCGKQAHIIGRAACERNQRKYGLLAQK